MQLIIDTSSEYSVLALVEEGLLIASKIIPHAHQLSSSLLPDIQALVPEVKRLTSIAVGIGPGSYTGTRIGVAVAKTLSFALNIPLVSFCSLLAFLPNTLGIFAITMPSKTQETYLLMGEIFENKISIYMSGFIDREGLSQKLVDVKTLIQTPQQAPNIPSLLKWLTHCDPTPKETPIIYFNMH